MAKIVKSKNTEVLELEAVEDNQLDTVINQELVKNNVTDKVISELKNQYGGLKLRDIEDKEMYLEIKTAKKNTRAVGIIVEKLCKKGREDAIAIQKKWISKEKEVLAKIAEVEDPLQAEIDRFDAEVDRKENEAAQRREEAYIKRQSQLLKMGASYDNGSFNLNHIGYEMATIKDADEDIWNETILPKYQKEYEKNEAEKLAAEKKREEEAEALRQQQLEMDKQRRELEEQQRQFREQQEELNRQRDAAAQQERDRLAAVAREEQENDRLKREADQKAEDERREKNRLRLEGRCNQLKALGMNFNFQYDCYAFEDVNIDNKTELCLWSDEEWEAKMKEIAPVIEERKQAAEQRRKDKADEDIRIAQEEAARKERLRIEEEQRQAEVQRQQAAQRQKEEAEKATDKEKWGLLMRDTAALQIPEMKSASYKSRIAEFKKIIEKAKAL